MPGRARLARTADYSGPRSWMTTSARVRLAETQKKRSGRSSMGTVPRCSASTLSTRRPADKAISGSVGVTSRRPCAGDVLDHPHPLGVVQAPGTEPGHDRADAGAADHVDGHPGLLQRPDHAEVGKPAGAAAAEHQAAAGAGDHPRQPCDIARSAGAQVVVVGHRPAVQPPGRGRTGWAASAWCSRASSQRSESDGQRACFDGADRRVIPGRGDQQHHVGLAQAEPAP